jgi:hypothetical protein
MFKTGKKKMKSILRFFFEGVCKVCDLHPVFQRLFKIDFDLKFWFRSINSNQRIRIMTTQSHKKFYIIKPGERCDGYEHPEGAIKVVGCWGLHIVEPQDGSDWEEECDNLRDWMIEKYPLINKSVIDNKIKKLKDGLFL